MDSQIFDSLSEKLDNVITYDEKGSATITSVRAVVQAVNESVCSIYKQRLKNLAEVSKSFIEAASQSKIDDELLADQLKALEYAIKLAEDGYNE